MKLQIEITTNDLHSIARVLEAELRQGGYSAADGDVRDAFLTRLVCRAVLEHKVNSPAIRCILDHAVGQCTGGSRRLRIPKSRRSISGGH